MFTKFLSLPSLAVSFITASAFITSCADDIPEPLTSVADALSVVELDLVPDAYAAIPVSRAAELSYAVFNDEGDIIYTSEEKDAPTPVKTSNGWHLSLPLHADGKYSVTAQAVTHDSTSLRSTRLARPTRPVLKPTADGHRQ